MPLHVSGITGPSSGGSAQMKFGVIMCVITPNCICAEPSEDWRVKPETCRGIDS
jgi:hypothetical protein